MTVRSTALAVLMMFVAVLTAGCDDGLVSPASGQTPGGPVRSVTVPEVAGETNGGMTKTGRFFQGTIIASDPTIHRTPSGLRMFYTDLDVFKTRTVLATATSTDGAQWSTQGVGNGVSGIALAGREGQWDENIESAAVVRVGGKWNLYYSGYRDKGVPFKGFPAAMGLAVSTDGQNFQRVSRDPILSPTPGWYDNDAIYSATVHYENGKFHMIYVGHAYTDTSKIDVGGVYLLGATSTDGVNWTKLDEPIARPWNGPAWRSHGVAEPYLVKGGDGKFYLFFTGLNDQERTLGVGVGSSPLGPFRLGTRPILLPGKRGTPDEALVLAPAVLLDGDTVRMWYLASTRRELLSIGEATGRLSEVMEFSQ